MFSGLIGLACDYSASLRIPEDPRKDGAASELLLHRHHEGKDGGASQRRVSKKVRREPFRDSAEFECSARAKFYKPGLLLFLSKFSQGQCFAQVPAVAAHLNLPCHFVRWQRQAAACGPFSSVQLFRAEMAIDHLSGRRFLNECAICLGLAPLLLSPSLCARLRREQVP